MSNEQWMPKGVINNFSPSELDLLKTLWNKEDFDSETDLFQADDPSCQRMFLIVSGYVKVLYSSPDFNMPVVVAILGPGASFGTEFVLSATPCHYTVQTVSKLRVLSMDRQNFEQLNTVQPIVANRLLRFLLQVNLERLHTSCERLVETF